MRKEISGHYAALLTELIWGTTFVSTKILLPSFLPIEILFFRFLIGYLALWCISPHMLKVENREEEKYFALAGLTGACLYYLLENIALTYTLATNVAIIVAREAVDVPMLRISAGDILLRLSLLGTMISHPGSMSFDLDFSRETVPFI